MNQELESRLAKLENCCADYRTQIGELEEKVLSHKEEEKRLHRTYEEMEERLRQSQEELNGQLRRTYEKMDEQLRSVRPSEGAIHPEFLKDADIHAEKVEKMLPRVHELLRLANEKLDTIMSEIDKNPRHYWGHSWGEFGGVQQITSMASDILEKVYQESIISSQLYKLGGNFPAARKFRQLSEQMLHDIHSMEIKIQKYHDKVLAAQRGDIGGRKTRRNKKRNSFKK